MLVEADLWSIINRETAPIIGPTMEMVGSLVENQLPDLIRTHTSRLAQDIRDSVTLSLTENAPASRSSRRPPSLIASDHLVAGVHSEMANVGSNMEFYQEPAHLSAEEASASISGPIYQGNLGGTNNQFSDSGYGTGPSGCYCSCHSEGMQSTLSFGNNRPPKICMILNDTVFLDNLSCESCRMAHVV